MLYEEKRCETLNGVKGFERVSLSRAIFYVDTHMFFCLDRRTNSPTLPGRKGNGVLIQLTTQQTASLISQHDSNHSLRIQRGHRSPGSCEGVS